MSQSQSDQILAAIKQGHATREALMKIETIRHMTWAKVAESLKSMTKAGVLIESKAGWRLSTSSKKG